MIRWTLAYGTRFPGQGPKPNLRMGNTYVV